MAGYEAALGHDITPEGVARVPAYLAEVRAAPMRLTRLFETDHRRRHRWRQYLLRRRRRGVIGWRGRIVRTIVRSGCYLTHDHGLYARTSPLRDGLRPAMEVWAQVMSRPEPDLALLTMGRRDVSFDQDMPVPLDLDGTSVTKLNDQHAYLRLGRGDDVEVGGWLQFGISHPCTTFDKWQMIPVLDATTALST